MDYKELQLMVENLRSDVDKILKMKNIPTNELESLRNDYRALQRASDDRYRITSSLMTCKIITGTTHASAGTESTHAHYLNKTPNIVLLLAEANATIYLSKASDPTNFYLKSSANSTPFTAFVLY